MLRSSVNVLNKAVTHPEQYHLNLAKLSQLLTGRCRLQKYTTSTSTSSNEEAGEAHRCSTKEAETTKDKTETESDDKLAEKDRLIAEKDDLLKELEEKYKRSLADSENVLQRGRKQIEDAKRFGIQGFSKDLLEVADILEKATESVPREEVEQNDFLRSMFEGLQLTGAQLQKVFNKNGLEKISPMGEKFDPHSHEALFQLNLPDKEEGSIAVVEKVGYKLHGRTLRPALVGVVKHA